MIYGAATHANVDLATLTTSQGFRIDGAATGDWSGWSVAGAGDVDGDRRDDIIIGARFASNNGRGSSGSSYVIYGASTHTDVDLAALTASQGFRINSAATSDWSGWSVASAGDVNGDGRDDSSSAPSPTTTAARAQDRRMSSTAPPDTPVSTSPR